MKTSYAKLTTYSAMLFVIVSAALSAIFAAFMLDVMQSSGMAGIAGAIAAGIGAFSAGIFAAKKTRLPLFALVSAAVCATLMLIVSLAAGNGEYGASFASPAACAAGGSAAFLASSLKKPSVKRRVSKKTAIKRR